MDWVITYTRPSKTQASEDLVQWKYIGSAYSNKKEKEYWAPSVIHINGIFYMYYSSITEGQQEECMKVATSALPEGPFTFVKQFFPWFSIDSQPVMWEGQLFMFYSSNTETGTLPERPGTAILLDLMKNPFEFSGNPRLVLYPSLDSEIFQKNRFGDGRNWHTIEGASFLELGKQLFLLFSANAYINKDYYIGFATGEKCHDLRDVKWHKYPDDYTHQALLKKTIQVEGTGHNSVTKAPNLIDNWIVYHGRNCNIPLDFSKEQRTMRIDPLYQDGEVLFSTGPTIDPQPIPSKPDALWKNLRLSNTIHMTIPQGTATAQVWMAPEVTHTGAKYGLILGSYHLTCTVGKNSLELSTVNQGIYSKEEELPLPQSFNHLCMHVWRITRTFDWWTISLDDTKILKTRQLGNLEGGIFSTFTTLIIKDLRVTHAAILEEKALSTFGNLFSFQEILRLEEQDLVITKPVDLTPKYSQGEFLFTVLPISQLSKFEVLDNDECILATIPLEKIRTIQIGYLNNKLHFMGEQYSANGYIIRLSYIRIQSCQCKNLK